MHSTDIKTVFNAKNIHLLQLINFYFEEQYHLNLNFWSCGGLENRDLSVFLFTGCEGLSKTRPPSV